MRRDRRSKSAVFLFIGKAVADTADTPMDVGDIDASSDSALADSSTGDDDPETFARREAPGCHATRTPVRWSSMGLALLVIALAARSRRR